MSQRQKEFLVSNAVIGESGLMTVIGRCGDTPIPLGTLFKVAYREKKPTRGEPLPKHPEREQQIAISLEVIEISAYGRPMRALPSDTTGCLVFRETDLNHAPPGWVLAES
jgi:hypothetical protein